MPPELLSNSRHTELPHTPLWKHGFRRCRVGTVHTVIVYEAGPKVVPPITRLITKKTALGNDCSHRLRAEVRQVAFSPRNYGPMICLQPGRYNLWRYFPAITFRYAATFLLCSSRLWAKR